jgi:uncharacterized protein YndB with AHSA1/START domain
MATAKPQSAPTEQEFSISREFNAPRLLVWKALTEADRLAQWWGPKGCNIRVAKLDVRPGGIFHYAMAWQPGRDMWGRFIYREVEAPEKLVYVSSFSDPNGGITRAPFKDTFPLEVSNVLTLSESGGKTTMTLHGHPLDAGEAERKTYLDMFGSMQQGFSGTFEQLDAYLAKAGA